MKKYLFKVVFLFVFIGVVKSQIYVNSAAAGLNNGTSWANAYTDLQTAISNTSSGEIWVAAGYYYPGASGNRSAAFPLKNNVQIYGGFAGVETSIGQRDIAINVTVLSGDLDMSTSFNANDSYHVVVSYNEDSTAVLDGFRIVGGNADGGNIWDLCGGGFSHQPTVSGYLNPIIRNCTFINNYGNMGSAIGVVNWNVPASNVRTQVLNCKIINHSNVGGGVIFSECQGSGSYLSSKFENLLISNNSATVGGVVAVDIEHANGGRSDVRFVNTTIVNNAGGNYTVYFRTYGGPGTLTFDNSILFDSNFGGDAGCNGNHSIEPSNGILSGSNNLSANPMFVNAPGGDYHLLCSSPGINAGNNSYISQGNDLDANPRVQQTMVDLGVYESNYTPPTVIANASATTICDFTSTTLYGTGSANVTYAWDNGATDGSPVSPHISTLYTVTGTDANGCSATDMINIVVNPLPAISANTTAATVCKGSNIVLYGTGGVSYSWDNGVIDGNPFGPLTTTYYSVTGTDINGCVNTSGINIVVEDSTMVSAGNDLEVCRTGTPSITLAGNNSGSLYFQWTTDGTGSFTNDMMPNSDYYFSGADASGTGVYFICTVNFVACATTRDTMHVTFGDPVVASAGSNIDICASNASSVALSASAASYSNIFWSTLGSGTFSPDQVSLNVFYSPSAPEIAGGSTILTFMASPNNVSCPSVIDSVTINYHTDPIVNVGLDQTICESDSIQLNATINGGTGPYTYNWTNGLPATISVTLNEYYTPPISDIIGLAVVDVFGCQGSDQLFVTVDASNNLSGNITSGGGPLTDGTLYLFKYIPQQLAFDTLYVVPFAAGTGSYSFSALPHGNYLIKIIPDTLLFPNALPTYFGDVFQWDSATVISHNCSTDFTANIDMMQMLGGTGTAMIVGHVLEGDGFGTRLNGTTPHIMTPGGPLKGIDVKLGKNPAGGIQARTMTDSTGYYEFTDLPYDSYRIYVDIPGLPMDSFYVVSMITATDSVYNMDYMVDSNSVFPMLPTAVGFTENKINSLKYSLFPNPASTYTAVDFDLINSSSVQIELLDISGRMLWATSLKDLPKGKHQYQINFADAGFVNGMYFIRVTDRNSSKTSKLVIEK